MRRERREAKKRKQERGENDRRFLYITMRFMLLIAAFHGLAVTAMTSMNLISNAMDRMSCY